jgi:hypothetical protein
MPWRSYETQTMEECHRREIPYIFQRRIAPSGRNLYHDDRYPESRAIHVPDYNLVKQCRNFDAFLEWTIDRSVPD